VDYFLELLGKALKDVEKVSLKYCEYNICLGDIIWKHLFGPCINLVPIYSCI
jgi:hypothetical protein